MSTETIDYTFDVENVVGSGKLPTELNLDKVTNYLEQHGEITENQSGYNFFPDDWESMITIYKGGSYIIRSDTKERLQEVNTYFCDLFREIGIVDSQLDIEISNVVGVMDLQIKDTIDLYSLNIALGLEHTEYEPEQFPALVYRRSKYPCTFLIFASGKVVCPGGTDIEELEESVNNFYSELMEWESEIF